MLDTSVFRTYVGEALEDRLRAGIDHAMALGADGAEAFVTVSRGRRAKVQNGALQDLTTSKRGGVGVRVLRAGAKGVRTGIATSTDLTRADFGDLFGQAWQLSALGDEDPWLRQAEPEGEDDLPSRHDPRGDALTSGQRIERAMALETAARQASPRVAAVREASWADGAGASLLLTQKGVRAFDLSSSCSASIELAVEEAGDRQAAWHWDVARHPDALDLAAIGREAARKGERKLRPAQLPSGRYRVVLHPEVTVDLLGLVAGMLSAEAVLKGRSLFAGKQHTQIASPLLTLIDDGRLPDGLGSEPWDGEGLTTRRNVLLDHGVLCTYLHTLRSAAEMGVAPTGTASRGTGSNPGVTTFNLFPPDRRPYPGGAVPEGRGRGPHNRPHGPAHRRPGLRRPERGRHRRAHPGRRTGRERGQDDLRRQPPRLPHPHRRHGGGPPLVRQQRRPQHPPGRHQPGRLLTPIARPPSNAL